MERKFKVGDQVRKVNGSQFGEDKNGNPVMETTIKSITKQRDGNIAVDFDNAYGPPTFQGQRVLTHFYNKGLTYETPEQALILMSPNQTPNTSRNISKDDLVKLIHIVSSYHGKHLFDVQVNKLYKEWKTTL